MNTFGRLLRLTSWGESHGSAIGGVLDGLPAGIPIELEAIEQELERRAPGRNSLTSPRREPDELEVLSGIYEGRTLGTPIGFIIRNQDTRSADYTALAEVFRPGHADYTYHIKYGHRDPRGGGGRSSARETAVRVAAGALVRQWLSSLGIRIAAYASAIGAVSYDDHEANWEAISAHRHTPLRCPSPSIETAMQALISEVREAGDSIGGIVSCRVSGLPAGLGEPIYDKLEARLASAMLSINASRGFELGDGFALSALRGSEANDTMYIDELGLPAFRTNHSGGTLGGISTGQELHFRVAFKPTPTIAHEQTTISSDLREVQLSAAGRHDPCVVPRAIPVIEAMCALVLGDMLLLNSARIHSTKYQHNDYHRALSRY